MKDFFTSVAAVAIILVVAMALVGVRPSNIPQIASAIYGRVTGGSAASAPSATPENSPAHSPSPAQPPQSAQVPAVMEKPVSQGTPEPARLTLAALKASPQSWPKSVELKEATEFPAMFNGQVVGSMKVRPGTMVDLVSVDDNGMLHVQYQGAPKEVPAAATDVLERSESGIAANAQAMARAEEARNQFNLSFTAVDGSPVDISRLRGHVVLVDFWATWCPPCMQEVPNVVAAYRKYHDQGFDIIGISLDQDRQAMLSVTQSRGMTWPQYFDGRGWDNMMVTSFGIHSVPTMWLVNKKGVLVSKNARDDLDSEVAKLLAE